MLSQRVAAQHPLRLREVPLCRRETGGGDKRQQELLHKPEAQRRVQVHPGKEYRCVLGPAPAPGAVVVAEDGEVSAKFL